MATLSAPRGPKGHLLSGHFPEFRRDALGFALRSAREYGDVVPFRFGPRRALLLSHPDHIEQVLVTRHREFVKGDAYRIIARVVGNGLFTSEGELWLRQRRLAQPAFHRDRVEAYGDVMVRYASRIADDWRDGETREVHGDMTRLTLAVVSKALLDADVDREATRVGELVTAALHQANLLLNSMQFFVPAAVPTPANVRLRRVGRELDEIVYGIIAARRASGEDRGDLLSMLLRAREDEGGEGTPRAERGSGMSDRQLRDEVMTVFLAGHETTAVALSWIWYLLSQHPDAEARLHAEIDAMLGARIPAVADVARLRFAGAVVSEALRLYPPAPFVERTPRRDVELAGVPVPKRTILLMSQWVTHRDARFFDRPDEFVPERWLDGLAERLPKFTYFPFGGGPRTCIGASFAKLEATLVLATIARRFRLRLAPDQVVEPEALLTVRPRGGLRMVIERRSS